jgi:hypothetical protein
MPSLFGGFGCFFLAILIFMVIGFQRGWKREVISLVFVLLASVLVHKDTSDIISAVLGRIPTVFAYMTGTASPPPSTPVAFLGGPVWSLIIFAGLIALGYFVGDKVMPKPANPQERFIGVIPSVLSGAFILGYLSSYVTVAAGNPKLTIDLSTTDPNNFVPVIVMIAILALVVALIAARVKKAPGRK